MPKPQYNIFFGYSIFHQIVHNLMLSNVALKPDFFVFDVKMKNNGENKTIILPTTLQQLKMIVFTINKSITVDVGHVYWLALGMFLDERDQNILVFLYFIHAVLKL